MKYRIIMCLRVLSCNKLTTTGSDRGPSPKIFFADIDTEMASLVEQFEVISNKNWHATS